mgnify:CR=1 FL=1
MDAKDDALIKANARIMALDRRTAILEDRIRYALDLTKGGFWAAAVFELDRALSDPDFQLTEPK